MIVVDQVNICWATAANPVARLNDTMMNEKYKSLRAARPSAASYTIELAELSTMTSTTVGSSSRTSATAGPSSISSTSSSPSASPSSQGDSDSGLSGGAIGGIVGGVVGGIAVIGAIAFFLWRRRKYSTLAQADPSSPTNGHHPDAGLQQPHTGYQPEGAYQPHVAEMHATAPPTEKYANTGYVPEMPAYQAPIEMSADLPRQRY